MAKGIKAAIQESQRTSWLAAGKPVPAEVEQASARYTREQEGIKAAAERHEHERDQRSEEADHLLAQHHQLANAVALLQVGIALGAVAALTRTRSVWLLSVGVGVVAAALFLAHVK